MVTVIEQNQISPPPGLGEMSLPLSFFDVPWLYFRPTLELRFYDFPTLSKSHFISSIVPNLKRSLSVTLKHFLPFAGNLIVHHSNTSSPEIRYVEGDTVSVTFAECSKDFNHLTGNHARNANEFRGLVPQLESVDMKDSCKIIAPTLAIQVTLFPNQGMSIGFANLHVTGDASTTLNFIKAWSSVSKFGGDEPFLASGSLPFYNRDVIKDPHSLATKYLNKVGVPKFEYPHHVLPNLVHATFIMTQDQIQQLKELTLIELPTITHLSSFTVICAYIWSCAAKVRAVTRNLVEADQEEVFGCSADFRTRLDPPLPPTYFGNCLVPCIAISKRNDLVGEGGFLKAVELIGNEIFRTLNTTNAVVEGMEWWIQTLCSTGEHRTWVGVAGSPKYNFYDTDFGWGKPKKYEAVSIDSTESISLNPDQKFGRNVEIGLCFTQTEMDLFGNIFSCGLRLGRP